MTEATGQDVGRVEQRVKFELSMLLGVPVVDNEDNLFRLGMDSLTATRIVAFLKIEFGVDTRIQTVFERPRVEDLVQYVISELKRRAASED